MTVFIHPAPEQDVPPPNQPATPVPRSADVDAIRAAILEKLAYSIGKDPLAAKEHDWLDASILALRDRIIDRWMESTRDAYRLKSKRVYYLSLEFLIGRLLRDALSNLELVKPFRAALANLGVNLDLLAELEPDAALGNGGLGRLAACFMESLASLGIPAYGYGIRYQHGLFRQKIVDGRQVELPEDWLANGNPWEFPRREAAYEIGFGGTTGVEPGPGGKSRRRWVPGERVMAVAHDTPMVGWRGRRVNTLRLWSARAIDPIRLDAFNSGDFTAALDEANRARIITRVLYPSDATPAGQELRLRQEFFFTSASLQDILRRHWQQYGEMKSLPTKIAIQLNDTHPAIAVAELMRLLMDRYDLTWVDAWETTRAVTSYTNHTLLPEALESWPLYLFERLLPRHMQIIYGINEKLIGEAQKHPNASPEFLSAVSLIDESNGRRVRMGQLAFVGSRRINGVSALHTTLMSKTVFGALDRLYPGRITNKTNGITPRRWLQGVNPDLAALLRDAAGESLLENMEALERLRPLADDAAFRARFMAIKRSNKEVLARFIREAVGVRVDSRAMFDVQIKRIHEYKRQLLNILETIALYEDMRTHPERDWTPRVKIFAGKAAASYAQAKFIIKLISDVAHVVNSDGSIRDCLKIVFLPNYNVSLAERIVPAADLSEQISTAGMEASGTGNMKLALNGALTIGTLDGANIEIRDHVGQENIEIFGLTAAEVMERRPYHDPRGNIAATPALQDAMNAMAAGIFSAGDPDRHRPLVEALISSDHFMVTDDFAAYATAQRKLDELWQSPEDWTRKAIHNTLGMGWFSSDRTIREYARDVWDIPAP